MRVAPQVIHFDARTGRQLPGSHRDTRWHSWTSKLGFPVMGIWAGGSDGSDVNSVDRSPSGRYLITCEDTGQVRHIYMGVDGIRAARGYGRTRSQQKASAC